MRTTATLRDRLPKLAAVAIIAVVAAGFAPAAAQAKPKKPTDVTTIVVTDQEFDANGTLVGESRRESQTTTSSGSVDADAGDGSGFGTMKSGGGGYLVQSPSGCRNTTIGMTRTSAWDQFYLEHTKQYCWANGRVYGWNYTGDPASWTYFNNLDGQHINRGTTYNAWYEYYSSQYGASGYGLHRTRAITAVETCIAGQGCLWTEYPYIEIAPRNNGTYSYSWYDGD